MGSDTGSSSPHMHLAHGAPDDRLQASAFSWQVVGDRCGDMRWGKLCSNEPGSDVLTTRGTTPS